MNGEGYEYEYRQMVRQFTAALILDHEPTTAVKMAENAARLVMEAKWTAPEEPDIVDRKE
jgi:hypothetical protein